MEYSEEQKIELKAQIDVEAAAKSRMMRFYIASMLALQTTLRSQKAFGTDVHTQHNGDPRHHSYEGSKITIQISGGVWDISGNDYTFVWKCEIPSHFLDEPNGHFDVHLEIPSKRIDLSGVAHFNKKGCYRFYTT